MTPPAAKRRRSVEHSESTRNINVIKGGLSIMCPADSMGMLIGKGGSGLRGMQEKSGVKVSLQETKSMPEGAKERGVGLSGSLVNVAAVERIIFEKLNARRVTSLAPSPAEEEFEIAYQAAKAAGLPVNGMQEDDNDPSKVKVVRWVMDNSHCGWLIGKGGSGIQNIEATSGAEVRVATEKSMTKESGERIVYIKGTPFQREKALEMIRSNPKISGRVAGAKEAETAAVHVPSKAIGFILGHRGASIQALTEKTGAQLRVAPSSEITTGSSESRVDITGGPQQIVAARHALGERIDEWRATTNPSSAPEEIEYSIKIAVPQPLVGHIIGKGGQFVREVLAITSVQVKIQQDTGSPTLWGDACCVMLSGTMDNVVKAQQMILERIANISDRLKDMVPNAVTISPDQDPDDPVRKLEVNIQLPDGPPPVQGQHPFQQPPPFGQQQQPAFGFAPPFGQPGPGGPFMPGQQQFQPQFQQQQQQFQQPPQQQPHQQQQQGYRQPQAPSGPPGDNVTQFTSIRQLNAPGLTAASKQPGGLELLVDNSVVGSIIGKGGQTIRKISTESGATIQVQGRDDVSPSQRERRVTVTSDEMPALLKAANMICGVLRNNEKMSNASRQGGPPGAGGGPGSNGAAGGGGGDRERGPPRGQGGPHNGPRGGSGPPPASPSGAAAPTSFPYQQQQQQPVPVQFSPTPGMAAFPPQQGYVAQQPVAGVAPIQQAYAYPQQVPGQGPPQQQLVQQAPQQQQQPAQAAAGQFGQQQQPPQQQGQQPPQQGQQPGQPGQPGQQPGAVFYQQAGGGNGPPQGNPQGVQYAQAQQQPPQQPPQQQQQQQPPAQQQQQSPHMQQQTPQQQQQALPVQQLPLQGQGQAQPPTSGASAPTTSPPAPVYGWVYDQASGTYTAAPAAATPAPQSSSFPAQPQYSQQQQQPPQQQQPSQQQQR